MDMSFKDSFVAFGLDDEATGSPHFGRDRGGFFSHYPNWMVGWLEGGFNLYNLHAGACPIGPRHPQEFPRQRSQRGESH